MTGAPTVNESCLTFLGRPPRSRRRDEPETGPGSEVGVPGTGPGHLPGRKGVQGGSAFPQHVWSQGLLLTGGGRLFERGRTPLADGNVLAQGLAEAEGGRGWPGLSRAASRKAAAASSSF